MIIETDTVQTTDEEQPQMASGIHGEIGAIITWNLSAYVYPKKLGRVFIAQTNFKINDVAPPKQPDVAFISTERLPVNVDEDIPFAPDLAVEISSRSDDWSEIVKKAKLYIQSGVKLVWAIDPYDHNVFVFRPDQPTQLYTKPTS